MYDFNLKKLAVRVHIPFPEFVTLATQDKSPEREWRADAPF